MANAKRAANRAAGKRMASSGSPLHTERSGSGPVAGAGEVYTGGPGRAARSAGRYARNDPMPAASGSNPKGMKTYNQE